MHQTLDLLTKALKQKTVSEWARTFNISPSTITNARSRGRLSPTLAGGLAMKLGEDPQQWIAIAALEAEPESDYKNQLLACVTSLYYWMAFIVVLRQRSRKDVVSLRRSTPGCLAK